MTPIEKLLSWTYPFEQVGKAFAMIDKLPQNVIKVAFKILVSY